MHGLLVTVARVTYLGRMVVARKTPAGYPLTLSSSTSYSCGQIKPSFTQYSSSNDLVEA